MTHRLAPYGSLLIQSWVQAGRLLLRWRRDQAVLMGSLLLPVFLLFVYKIVLGEQVQKVTGVDSVYGVVPMCAVISALFGSLGNSVGITMDRQSRLLSRMWVLPIHRASAISGWVLAEIARAFIGTILITAIGVAMGLRFTQGWPAALLFLLIPSIVVTGFTALVMAMAIRNNGRTAMTWLLSVTFALAFVNPGATPIKLFPDWAQPLIRMQPISPPIETMRALAHGGPIEWPLAATLIWAVVLLAVFIPIAVRGYRLAAEANA
ncbi:ABC transporter permease [Mycobacterium intracellulare]|uniref:Transport permease protein n=2 Tax=Mycobacterium avium complex (MAC) TaxID=120793 RepID=A2A1E2_MYCIT|nr:MULTISPECIES: ABC transporter permease [Mycobacterium avium complex (MAC)]MCA2320256.1 ABC transporter permease [Mycobacterium intracellulare]MCA2339338.1 ABC transporter permease [Mycobacterium intracellulare]MDV6978114.1 ABC transporter permease [Mycobacterium intracellulare]MDV6983528.1 ABC transporter permease [Mycobacterium intracellulare]MDV7012109.1 ABC transporter permease [Mycobacterium intracellulare]